MNIQPAPNEPALLLHDHAAMVVADLHIGIEQELREAGASIPSQTKTMEARLYRLIEQYQIHALYLLGDVKHNIPTSTIQERTDVKFFLQRLTEKVTVHILPGNHDGTIERLAPPAVRIHPSSGLILGDIGLLHGHRWPSLELFTCPLLIVAHTHPTILFTDRMGTRAMNPAGCVGLAFPRNSWRKPRMAPASNLSSCPPSTPSAGGSLSTPNRSSARSYRCSTFHRPMSTSWMAPPWGKSRIYQNQTT